MDFTHLIEINDPLNPLLQPLSRAQLWRALVLRAEQPQLFLPHLDQCTILARDADSLQRELRYGTILIRDRVLLLPQQQVQYRVPAQADIPESSLDMIIEEPQPDLLYVRFVYHDDDGAARMSSTDGAAAQAMYDDFRRSAYEEADIDTIRIVRTLAL